MSKLDAGQMHLLRLTMQGAAGDGWAPVSAVVWPLIAALPSDLVELLPSDNGGHARLTHDGEVVLRYS